MKGYGWITVSVLLVSAAQLMMRWAMPQLPEWGTIIAAAQPIAVLPALMLLAGLAAYGFSMLCWVQALRHLPLNRAYPLLSLSYVLVWLAAVSLPVFHEPFSWQGLAGVILILAGLLCIVLRPSS